MNRSLTSTMDTIKKVQARYPFAWRAIHTDNDSAFINWQLKYWSERQKIQFSRSRPYHKNDNCFIEQKNSSHVRRTVGHFRYDTKAELNLLNDLYFNELYFYKNFFQPTIKLVSKERIGGHIKRRYDKPKTPYQRVMENKNIPKETKDELQKMYESLNPAELKRNIDQKLHLLKQLYNAKHKTIKVEKTKELNINTVTFSNCTTNPISVT